MMMDLDTNLLRARGREDASLHDVIPAAGPPTPVAVWHHVDGVKRWLKQAMAAAARAEPSLASPAEWLLDNGFQVQRAAIQIKQDLPPGFYRRLRCDTPPSHAREPLVLAIAHDLLAATHVQLSRDALQSYLEGYQQHRPLNIAELWALPVMLRLACLERLIAGFAALFPAVPCPFEISATARGHLRAQDAAENVARGIANLAVISSIAWNDVFDAASLVERTLTQDPGDTYRHCDFETRDAYRRAVERLASRAQDDELGVAQAALTLARSTQDAPENHVGYWLVGSGAPQLEMRIAARVPLAEQVMRRLLIRPGASYSMALFLLGLLGLVTPALYLTAGQATLAQAALGLALSAIPATVIAVTAVNWLITLSVPPVRLCKLDFSKGIDPAWPTLVAVPVILRGPEEIPALIRRLEGHFLANRHARGFVILSDPCDADREKLEDDALVEQALVAAVDGLNHRYAGPTGAAPFCLLHRARRFNAAQGCWIAWERKRGKLEQFNDFLLRGSLEAFPVRAGPIERLPGARFVVTADLDTRLPPGCVARLAATLAHPLNRPLFDVSGRTVSGYTVLQPRVEIAPHGGDSAFARLFGGDTAIDIYSRAVSDVYQDLIGSGNYVGKGIYDVAAFSRSLESRVPENNLLSHDLWEGLHGRAGLVSDVIVYESFPSNYLEYTERWHRWVRGDWQLLPWLLSRVPAADGLWLRNRLTGFDRLRLWDTMRRSLIPPCVFTLLLAGWFALPGDPLVWTLMALTAPAAYLFTDLVTGVARGRRRGVLTGTLHQAGEHLARWALSITFLVSDTGVALHAIATTWVRLCRRRGLLEWTSAAHASLRLADRGGRAAHWVAMWLSPAAALVLGLALTLRAPAHTIWVALPLLCLWLIAPQVAWWTGRPRRQTIARLDAGSQRFLRLLARRSWLFFEERVGPEDHWLAPDNHQEEPVEITAHRTSPTNIGMMVLSTLGAWRLGHIGTPALLARMREMLVTLARLETWCGHILNWYDTRTLAPLEPRYISTVDSGNLAVSLVTLASACDAAVRQPAFDTLRWQGLDDALALMEQGLKGAALRGEKQIEGILADLRGALHYRGEALEWPDLIEECQAGFAVLRDSLMLVLDSSAGGAPGTLRELQTWLDRSECDLLAIRRDLQTGFPWLERLAGAPPACRDLAGAFAVLLDVAKPLDACALLLEQAETLRAHCAPGLDRQGADWLGALARDIRRGLASWRRHQRGFAQVSVQARAMAQGMNFTPLYDTQERLFHIGYDLSAERVDSHHYDLLASEARLASFFAIAKQNVPMEHWFQLGRPIAKHRRELALVSWNGSMFEYLMPSIFLRSDARTLLGESNHSAVSIQRRYAEGKRLPWGISESAFAATGPDGSWRYRAFGVPELGLRRGLAEDLVIAPYASALALCVAPVEAAANLQRLAAMGGLGRCGLYEALDFTPARVADGELFAPVRSYMAHHQGMSLAAIANALCDDLFVGWFHADPNVQTVELLLNERIPWELPPEIERIETAPAAATPSMHAPRPQPWQPDDALAGPAWHVLGNGRLATRIAADGSGAMAWEGLAITRPGDAAGGNGHFFHLRDLETGAAWSVTPMPELGQAERSTVFHAHKAEFRCRTQEVSATLDVMVAPAEDIEIRRLRLVNGSDRTRRIEIASHVEVALAPEADWRRHPAFARLFVSAEADPVIKGLILQRRTRSEQDPAAVLVQRVVHNGPGLRLTGMTATRRQTRRRYGDASDFPAIPSGVDAVERFPLDPVSALDMEVTLAPHGEIELAIVSAVASTREGAVELARRHGSISAIAWLEADAASRAARDLQALGFPIARLPEAQAVLTALQGVAGPRPVGEIGVSRDNLWALGVSGDHPILLFELAEDLDASELRFVLAAQRFWRWRGATVDLALLHTGTSGYIDPIRERVLEIMRAAGCDDALGSPGGVHLVSEAMIDPLALAALRSAAAVTLRDGPKTLTTLIDAHRPHTAGGNFVASRAPVRMPSETMTLEGLAFTNGHGGFTSVGDYRIVVGPRTATPAPWANVLANEHFGTIVTEAGLGWSFALNSGENRLTPWHNDPVCDMPGEALYLRDEESGDVWSITPQPAGLDATCQIDHAPEATVWTRADRGLAQEVTCTIADDEPAKRVRLRLTDTLGQSRRITATYVADWLLGAVHGEPAPFRRSWYRPDLHALLATNRWNRDFGGRTAFLVASMPPHSFTTSRLEFFGREENWRCPAGLTRWDLGDLVDNQGPDAIAALQVHLDLPAHGSVELTFLLGEADNEEAGATLVQRLVQSGQEAPGDRSGAIALTVTTPDPAFDLMVNRWLPHQTKSSRLFARAGFYQASGAYGFRDQLQDVMALILSDPSLARAQILRAAAHQFEAGDVLHWWHPPAGRGVRTRCSDDLLWLPYTVACYVEATGDTALLDEETGFLRATELADGEHDRYTQFPDGDRASLFEHCLRAFDRAWRLGTHGLPLIGDGDWNDGMNRVGQAGRGESVWLAWFMAATIRSFAELAATSGRSDFGAMWLGRADELVAAVERHGWDGAWYVRAFDDEGRPWGSSQSDECRIDSLAQSWAVMAGGDTGRADMALDAAFAALVREDDHIVRLLDPAFDHTTRDPGYIRAYPPGIRENGGQYSHAAAWLGIACARRGDGERAKRVFDRLNPIRHADTQDKAAVYQIEPYVMAGDIGGVAPHLGRGGWSWYTGAAAWTWRLGVEHILGIRLVEGKVGITPCLPPSWPSFRAVLRGEGTLDVLVEREGQAGLWIDGQARPDQLIAFPGEGRTCCVHLILTGSKENLDLANLQGGLGYPQPV